MRRSRVGAGIAALGLGAAGVVLVSVAALGADGDPYPVTLGSGTPGVSPVTASPSPGQQLVFVNAGSLPYTLTRTASPFPLSTTILPMTSSAPLELPTAAGSYPYVAQQQFSVSGPVSAQVVVAAASTQPGTPAPLTTGALTSGGSGGSGSPAASSGPTVSTAPSAKATRKASPKPSRRRSSKPSTSRRPSATPSPSASGYAGPFAISGGELPAPALPSAYDGNSSVPLPVLPSNISPSAVTAAGGELVVPVASATASPTAGTPPARGPIAADAPRTGPQRSRGLPIALATALLLGVGGAVVRALGHTRGRLRRTG